MTTRSSRRTFLATAVGAAAAPALSLSMPTVASAKTRRLKLGLASYSVRKFTLDQALEMCKEMELSYINLKDFHLPMTDSPEAIAAARKKIEAAGLTIMGGGTITLKNDAAQIRKAFEYAKAGGFPLMVVAPGARRLRPHRKGDPGVRHQGRDPQPRARGQGVPRTPGRLQAPQGPRPAFRPLHGHRPRHAGGGRPGQDRGRVQGPAPRPAREGPQEQDRSREPDRGGQGPPRHPRPVPRPPPHRLLRRTWDSSTRSTRRARSWA